MTIITKQELLELQKDSQNFVFDVREEDEYEYGHIPQAILAPWHSITERVAGLKPQTPIILYCNTGVRAQKAAKMLEDKNFTNVSVYRGGWEDWNN